MGYCMEQIGCNFCIKAENVPKAHEAIKALMGKVDQLGGGGSYSGGKKTESYFSWVNTAEVLAALDFAGAMREWRWEVESMTDGLSGSGDIDNINFAGEKSGDEDHLFGAIAPFVEDGSYIEMSGEDGTVWRWVFKGGKVKEITAKFTYDEDEDDEEIAEVQ